MKVSSLVITSLIAASTSFAANDEAVSTSTPLQNTCAEFVETVNAKFDEGKRNARRNKRRQRRHNRKFAGSCGF